GSGQGRLSLRSNRAAWLRKPCPTACILWLRLIDGVAVADSAFTIRAWTLGLWGEIDEVDDPRCYPRQGDSDSLDPARQFVLAAAVQPRKPIALGTRNALPNARLPCCCFHEPIASAPRSE